MSWNKVFNLFIDIKKELGENFTLNIPLKDLISQYCNEYYKQICEPLELNQNNELVLIRYGRYSNVFNNESEYDYMEFWDLYDGLYEECRSLVIDIVNEKIVLSPFKKFRNLNECEETKLENIQKRIFVAKNIEISNKLDGSMQCARWYNNQIIMSGSQAIDKSQSWRLEDGYNRLTTNNNYIKMLKENKDFTFIFEYISILDSHCVIYTKEQEGLYLIGMRNSITGEQLSYKNIMGISKKYNILTTDLYDIDLESLLNTLSKYKSNEKEGYVLNIDGFMVKIKCDDYVNIHGILSKISSINLVIKNIANNTFDDLISKVPEIYKERVMETATMVFKYIKEIDTKVQEYYINAPKDNIKDFMIWVNNNVPNKYQGYVRNIYKGIENNYIKSGNPKSPSYKKIKDMEEE